MKSEELNITTVGVIDLGTRAIRMVIAEITSKGQTRVIEMLQKPVSIGKDVFITGRIGRGAMNEVIEILRQYKEIVQTYQVKHLQVIATSAVREAQNRDLFTDRVYVRTGFEVEVIEGTEENRLNLLALESVVQEDFKLDALNCFILEVGAGSTEIIILNKGKVEYTKTLALGSARLPDSLIPGTSQNSEIKKSLRRRIQNIISSSRNEFSMDAVDTFIALGADMRLAAEYLEPEDKGKISKVSKKKLMKWLDQIGVLSPEEIAGQFNISFNQAQTLYASLTLYAQFFSTTETDNIYIAKVSMRDGILSEMSQMLSSYKRTDLGKQVVHSVMHIGKKFNFDKAHAQCVAANALKLYDALSSEHGLGSKERLLLEVAGLLHDIGTFISPTAHHKHSSYLIDASEIFGLRKNHKKIISNVVRYHRKSSPSVLHEPFMSLPKADRATVSKLAAILRVADALDVSHRQVIRQFSFEKPSDGCVIWVSPEIGDITMEREALKKKSGLFTDVFGLELNLKQGHFNSGL